MSIAPDFRSEDRPAFYESLLDSLKDQFVFCDPDDTILFMNKAAAEAYAGRGGLDLIGRSLLDCHNPNSCRMIAEIKARFLAEPDLEEVKITDNEKYRIWMRAVRENGEFIGYYERYEPPLGS